MKMEHVERTCVLNSEYVGVTDFDLLDGDKDFLERKGYATTTRWLDIRKRAAGRPVEEASGHGRAKT